MKYGIERVFEAAMAESGLSQHDLVCRERGVKRVLMRQHVAYALHELTMCSYPEIARVMSCPSHSTATDRIRAGAKNGGAEFAARVRKRLEMNQ